jgi:catechol 2,3-dioxygenase-like lactoylglutathione lyase family enzyme
MSFQLTRAIPVLPTPSIAESIRFYSRLGFSDHWSWTDQMQQNEDLETPQTLVYGGLNAPLELHFNLLPNRAVGENTTLRLEVQTDIEGFYAHCQNLGVVHPNSKLEAKP